MRRLRAAWAQLRVRIVFVFGAIALITYTLTGLAVLQDLAVDAPQVLQTRVDSRAQTFASAVEARVASQQDMASACADALSEAPRDFELRAYDDRGQLVFATAGGHEGSTGNPWPAPGLDTGDILSNPNPPERFTSSTSVVRRPDGATAGTVELRASLYLVDQILSSIRLRAVAGMFVSLVAILGAGLYIGSNITRVLREIERTANDIARGKFSRRAAVESNDEVGQLGATINNMATELERLSDVRAQFISKVSHELRTPLSIIKGFAVTLQRQPHGPGQERALAIIDTQTDQLTRLVNDLLDLSRLETGRLTLDRSLIDAVRVVEEVVESQRHRADDQGVELRFVPLTSEAVIDADSQRLRQILDNLLDNALKYVPADGQITVSVRQVDGEVVLEVSDNGPGIPPDKLPHVFERFYQAEPKTKGGAGLGLAIVKELAEAHGGRVAARSDPNRETVLTIALPLAEHTGAEATTEMRER